METILEYKPIDKSIPGIFLDEDASKNGIKGLYKVCALMDTWVYPWKYKRVELNLHKLYLPDNTIAMIVPTSPKCYTKYEIVAHEHHVYLRAKGLIPRKISEGEAIVGFIIVPNKECHLLEIKY